MRILITNSVPLNGGDEALLRATVESLQHRWPGSDLTILCSHVEQARVQLPDLAFEPDLEFAKGRSERERVSELYRAADVVLSAPGGFLHDFYPISDRLSGLEVAIALGKPVILFAQSIGPFWKQQSQRRIPEVLNRATLICVRDGASKEHLLECGVAPSKIRETADAAFLWRRLAPELFQPKNGPVRSIALCFRAWPLGDETEVQRTVDKAQHLCRRLLDDPERTLVFRSTCQGLDGYVDDSVLARQIVQRLPSELQARCRIDRARYSPRELIQAFGRCDAFIGMRLHGCILSMLGGTPALGLGYEQKTEEVFGQLDLKSCQTRFETPLENWLNVTDRFLTNIDQVRAKLPMSLDRLAGRAALNLGSVEESIHCGPSGLHNGRQTDWTTLAPKYDVPHLRLRQVAQLVRRLKPVQIVDLGCATGHLRNLCPAVRYVGCDFVAPSRPTPFPFYECDFNRQTLPADLQELELVVCSGLLEYIEDLPKFLAQLRLRLRDDGHLVATYFNMNHISRIWGLLRGKRFEVRPDWRGFYSPTELPRLMADAGFEVTDAFAMNHSLGSSPPVEETVDLPPVLRRVRPWSVLMAHQYLFVARAKRWDAIPVREINAVLSPQARIILVDDAQWPEGALPGRHTVPFLERSGQYWGPPADDQEAVRELERLRADQAEFVVFASPAFWWLEHYSMFARYLNEHFPCVLQNDQVMIFDLRTSADQSEQGNLEAMANGPRATR